MTDDTQIHQVVSRKGRPILFHPPPNYDPSLHTMIRVNIEGLLALEGNRVPSIGLFDYSDHAQREQAKHRRVQGQIRGSRVESPQVTLGVDGPSVFEGRHRLHQLKKAGYDNAIVMAFTEDSQALQEALPPVPEPAPRPSGRHFT